MNIHVDMLEATQQYEATQVALGPHLFYVARSTLRNDFSAWQPGDIRPHLPTCGLQF